MPGFWSRFGGLAILMSFATYGGVSMKHRTRSTCLAALVALTSACGGDAPPTAPVVVVTPTPAPTPTPTPATAGNPATSAVVAVFGYVRREGSNQGRFPVPPAPSTYQIGDAIDIGCTPRDA